MVPQRSLVLQGTIVALAMPALVGSGEAPTEEPRAVAAACDLARVEEFRVARTLDPHEDTAWAAAFAPDGARLVTGGWDHRVRCWDAATGEALWTSDLHGERLWDVAWTADGAHVVSAARGVVIVHDAATGEMLEVVRAHRHYARTAVHPSRPLLATSSNDGTRMWTLPGLEPTGDPPPFGDGMGGLDLHPTEPLLALGTDDGAWIVWNHATGEEVARVAASDEGHALWNVRFLPDGEHLVAGGLSPRLTLWNWREGTLVRRFEGHTNDVNRLDLSADGRLLLSGGHDATWALWDVATGEALRGPVRLGHDVTVAVLAPTCDRLAVGSRSVELWEVPDPR